MSHLSHLSSDLHLVGRMLYFTPYHFRQPTWHGWRHFWGSVRMTWRLHHNPSFVESLRRNAIYERNSRWRQAWTDWTPKTYNVRELIDNLRGMSAAERVKYLKDD